MRILLTYFGVLFLLSSCQSSNPDNTKTNQQKIHEVIVVEIIQTSQYTYLLVKEDESEHWVAVPKMTAETGKVYYYLDGIEMTNFTSKELNRTFESVLFLEALSADRESVGVKQPMPVSHSSKGSSDVTATEKLDAVIEPPEGGVSLAGLLSQKESYEGKTVLVKGKVTKFSSKIMGKNWIHIQDGTEYKGAFDLTITSDAVVNVGDIVVFEGKITLNKDFGFGYFYEILLEDGVLKK